MHPSGWHFLPGHRPKLELLGRDSTYSLPSNAAFSIEISDVKIDLPVQQSADGDQIFAYDPPELCTPLGRSARRGRRLGPVAIGRTRRTNRRVFEDARPRGRYMDSACVTGGRIRIGLSHPAAEPPRAARGSGRAVLALASTDRISGRARARVGFSERTLRKRVRPRWRLRIGRNRWYVKRSGRSTLVFKVRRGGCSRWAWPAAGSPPARRAPAGCWPATAGRECVGTAAARRPRTPARRAIAFAV